MILEDKLDRLIGMTVQMQEDGEWIDCEVVGCTIEHSWCPPLNPVTGWLGIPTVLLKLKQLERSRYGRAGSLHETYASDCVMKP